MATPVVTPQAPAAPTVTTDSVADVSWSKLFDEQTAPTGDTSQSAPAQQAPTVAVTPQAPQATAQPTPTAPDAVQQPFLKAGESIYMSAEDAAKGVEQKDLLITQLRNYAIQQTGVDPITGRQVQQPQQPQYGQPQGQPNYGPQQPVSYLQNPNQYYVDLKKAVDTGDQAGYARIQQQYFAEVAQSQFGAYAPILQNVQVNNAVASVSQQIPDFVTFKGSDAYKATLQANPTLAQAVQASEQQPQFAHQLPDLYKMVYALNQNIVLSQAMKAQQTTAANSANVARPTAAPTHATPGPQVVQNQGNFRTDDAARKALIESFEKSGRDGKI